MKLLFFVLALFSFAASFTATAQNTGFDDTAFIYDENFTQEAPSAGQAYLQNTAEVYYDFTSLTGVDASNISNGNAGLVDQSGNLFTATILSTPTVRDITVGSENVKTLGASGINAVTTGHDGTAWFTTDFKVYISFQIQDGQPASTHFLAGVLDNVHAFQIYIATGGELQVRYRTPTADSRWDSNNTPLLADGVNGVHVLEIEYDFTNDQFGVWLDESPVAGAFISGNMAALNPADFDPTINYAVGTTNLQGTIQSNANTCSILRYAVTPLNSSQQTADVNEFLNFIPTSTGTGFEKWVVHQTAGFSATTRNDSLILSGTPLGYQDYLYNVAFMPDSLGEFEIQQVVTIDNDLQSGDVGLGIGLINDLASEPNRGVIGTFITDPTFGEFGRAQIYSGTGAVSPTAFAFRGQSGGTFVPAKDSSYLFTLERRIQGNDVFYSFSVMDLWDSVTQTTGWTELNRTSDQYYGSTMRAIIYQNGGPFRIQPFTIHRTGAESGGGTTPPFDPDLVVQKTGDDANDCNPSAPCLTVNRLFQRIGELSPAVQDAFIGTGTFTETSFLNPPTNTGEVRGAGRNLTFISGASNLYTFTNRSTQSEFLVQLISGSSTNVTTKFRSMTFEGGRDFANDPNALKGAFAIRNRHGVEIHDVTIRNFNTCGLRLWDINTFKLDDFILDEVAGSNTTFPHYYIEFGTAVGAGCGGVTLLSSDVPEPVDTYNILISNGTFIGQQLGGGEGIGTKGGSGTSRYLHNTHYKNLTFDITAQTNDADGHNFNVETLDFNHGHVLYESCFFNANLSIPVFGLGQTDGYTRITGCTFDFDDPTDITFVIEMQVSKVVIDHNFIVNARNGVFTSLNVQANYDGGESGGAPTGQDHGDWHIHHNIIQLTTSSTYGIFGGREWDMKGMVFENNTIRFLNTSGGAWYGTVISDQTGDTVTGLVTQNNLFLGQPPPSSALFDPFGSITGGISRYNYSTDLNTAASRSGVTVSNTPAPFGSGNPFSLGLGTPPTTWAEAFTGNYYKPAPGSVLINSGFGSVTIGARD